MNGPNWDEDLQTICDNFDQETCDKYTAHIGMGQGVDSELYWHMSGIVDRFQEPIAREDWLAGQLYSDMVDLS